MFPWWLLASSEAALHSMVSEAGHWPATAAPAGTSRVRTAGHSGLKYFYNNKIFSTSKIFLLLKYF